MADKLTKCAACTWYAQCYALQRCQQAPASAPPSESESTRADISCTCYGNAPQCEWEHCRAQGVCQYPSSTHSAERVTPLEKLAGAVDREIARLEARTACQTCGGDEPWLHPATERCPDPWHLPKAVGVGRVDDNNKAILVHFKRRPSDDELRGLQEALAGRAPLSSASALKALAERCRPAVAHDARLRERDQYSEKYAASYQPVLKQEAERAAKLLDDIDAIIAGGTPSATRATDLERAMELYPDRPEHHEAKAEEIREGKRRP